MEEGYPKTASIPPTMVATDNTLLSGKGGDDNGLTEGLVGAGREPRTKEVIHGACHLLPCCWAPHHVMVAACPRTGQHRTPAFRV